jgi:hypothetical protein
MFFGGIAEVVENYSGLDAGYAALGIDFKDIAHVLREIENNGDVTALACERGASAAAEEWSAEFTAGGDCGEDIVGVAGKNYSDGDLSIIGAVGGVERARGVIEADLSAKAGTQSFGEPGSIFRRRRCGGDGINQIF